MSKFELPVWLVTNQTNVTDFYNVLDYLAFRCTDDKQRNLASMCNWCGLTETRLKLILSILVNSYILKKTSTSSVTRYVYDLTEKGYVWLELLSKLYLRVLAYNKKATENKISELRLTCERNKINCLDLPKGIDYYVEYLN